MHFCVCAIVSSINGASLNLVVFVDSQPIHRIRDELLSYTKRHEDVMASVPLFSQLLAAHRDMMQVRQPIFDDGQKQHVSMYK
jgi:hypothetical protein